jgi:multiple sugar transport system substrate-binding protein
MNKSKIIFRIACLILLGAMLVPACSQPAAPQTPEAVESKAPEAEPTEAPTVEPQQIAGEILIWGWPAADKAFEAIIEGFNENYPGVKVTWEMNPGMAAGTRDALSTALSAGSGAPDISLIEINDIGRFVMQGGLVDLMQPPYNAARYKDQFVPYKWQQALSPDGRLLAFPWDIGPASIFYRRDLFDKAGLASDPESVAEMFSTWDSFIEAGKKVNDPENHVYWMDLANNIPYIYYAHKNFYDEKYEVAVNNSKTLRLFELAKQARSLKMDAKVPAWTEEWYSMLGQGQIATTIAGCWFGGFLKSFIDPTGAGKWGVVPIPEDPLQNWGGSFLAITEQSKNKEAAWAFIEYALTNADSQNRIFVNVDYFPSFLPAWENPLYDESDFYFGGQKTRALWTQIATSEGKIFTTPMDSAAESIFNAEVAAMLDQDLDPQEVLTLIEQRIKDETAQDKDYLMEMLGE